VVVCATAAGDMDKFSERRSPIAIASQFSSWMGSSSREKCSSIDGENRKLLHELSASVSVII
jgi:hypothetical protein